MTAAMRSGIYGLFDLAGGPLDPHDAAILGLPAPATGPGAATPSATTRAIDHADPHAIHVDASGGMLTILLGHLEEREALAARLALPAGTPTATLARAALARFGAAASAAMIGEWSLLQWDGRGRVTLLLSPARRDPMLFALRGNRLAVAPDLFRLRKLDWVDDAIDAEGVLFGLGAAPVRGAIDDRTMLAGVRNVGHGRCATIDAEGYTITPAVSLDQAPSWRGSFGDAVDAAEQLLRRILRGRLARTTGSACLLSGGLDSSLLAWLAAQERGAGQHFIALTSAAPSGSGLADETCFAQLVAERLALPLIAVTPGERPGMYRPSTTMLARMNGPLLSVRHYLYDALADAAIEHRTPVVFDGSYGEMTVTGQMPLATPRYRLAAALRRLRRGTPQHSPFQVRLAPHRRISLPPAITEALRLPDRTAQARSPTARWGFFAGVQKSLIPHTELRPGQARLDYPFRDTRLLRLFSGFPATFQVQDGVTRAPARRMLDGGLPDAIRLRRGGTIFSPDYMTRLQREAPAARARIDDFRAAGIDDWLDLAWLDAALLRVATQGPADIDDAFEVQLTAITAEFLTWWNGGS